MPHTHFAMLLRVFSIFSAGYFLSYGLRVINAAIAPQLSHDLHLSHSELGVLSASYFIGFIALQLPLGVWLDKYPARRILALLLCVAALGCTIFALAEHFVWSAIGRGLMGAGVAGCFMVPLSTYRRWYSADWLKPLATGMLCIGTLGVLSTTVPVAWFVEQHSWRDLFIGSAVTLLVIAGLVWWGLARPERHHQKQVEAQTEDIGAFRWAMILRHPQCLPYTIVALLFQSSFNAMQSLWIGPWLVTVGGQDSPGFYLFVFNAVLLFAYLLLTSLTRFLTAVRTQKLIVWMLGACVVIGWLLGLVPASLGLPLWCLLFLSAATGVLIQAEFSTYFPKAIAGRVNTYYNLMIFVGVFLVQAGLGFFIDGVIALGASDATAMRTVPPMLACLQFIAFMIFLRKPR